MLSGWRRGLRLLAIAVSVLVVSTGTVAAYAVWQFQDGIQSVDIGGDGDGSARPPAIGAYPGGFNVLIVGADNEEGQDKSYGRRDSTLNDVNILLHVSADHERAIAVSIPRDLVAPMPECTNENGEVHPAAENVPINEALGRGGLRCVVDTVRELTGLEIQFAGLVTFDGVIAMSNAVGGVPVCVDGPIDDPYTGLQLDSAGEHVLSGDDALAFLRTRYSVGDGSDLGRINSQQVFLSSLIREVKSDDTLSNPIELYNLARAARDNMLLSESMSQLDTLVALARALAGIPLENVVFTQYPTYYRDSYPYAGKLAVNTVLEEQLLEVIRTDVPFELGDQEGRVGADANGDANGDGEPTASPSPEATASPSTPSESPAPGADDDDEVELEGLQGQTAAQESCSVANR